MDPETREKKRQHLCGFLFVRWTGRYRPTHGNWGLSLSRSTCCVFSVCDVTMCCTQLPEDEMCTVASLSLFLKCVFRYMERAEQRHNRCLCGWVVVVVYSLTSILLEEASLLCGVRRFHSTEIPSIRSVRPATSSSSRWSPIASSSSLLPCM